MERKELVRLARVRALAESGGARKIREAAGLSQSEVADHVGVGVATIARWESGERRPRGKPALRYGDLLDALAREREKELAQ